MEEGEQKSSKQLCQEYLEIIDRQQESNSRIRDIIERIARTSTKKEIALSEDLASELQNLFVETEALQGQARAVYHCLFGEEDDSPSEAQE